LGFVIKPFFLYIINNVHAIITSEGDKYGN
jgi:hypothetical protein